jgi:hypothetical protein
MAGTLSRLGERIRGALGIRKAQEVPLTLEAQFVLNELLSKSSRHIVPSFYDVEDVPIAAKDATGREDVTDTEAFRRAIHSISNYYNTLGTYRDDFDKQNNDKLSRNAYYSICEKAILDYIGSSRYQVLDKSGDAVEQAMEFIDAPNPQDSFGDLLKMSVRDLVRYDAGVWVKSFKVNGYLAEMKSYLGTEFWKEQDRVAMIVNMPFSSVVNFDRASSTFATHWQPAYTGWWSHGYVQRYWQRSRTGVYIPFQPEEICYLMMYPRSDGIYGTDFLKYLRYQLQYLIDSTKAAGKTFENGLVPSIVWGHEQVRNIQQLEQRIMEVRASNQGANKFGQILHTVQGEKVETLAQSLHNMEWLEGQKFVAQLIWATWGFSPTEFVGEGENRATAYVKRNVTKSRLLYPLMDHIEKKVNREVLPYLKGYRKGWVFSFLKDLDLDDDQKLAQTSSTRASTTAQYLGMGMDVVTSMKLAGLVEELKTIDTDALQQQILQFQAMQAGGMNGGGDDGENGEMGRYDSEGAGSEGYVQVNMSDYGQGGEFTEQRMGEEDEKQYRKAGENKADDRIAVNRKNLIRKSGDVVEIVAKCRDGKTRIQKAYIESANERIWKAKVYINSPSEAPKGRTVKRGARGGYYYITSERQPAHEKATGQSGRHPKSRRTHKKTGWNVKEHDKKEQDWEEPEPPDTTGADRVLVVGDGMTVSLYLMDYDGRVEMWALNNDQTKAFLTLVRYCFEKRGDDLFECVERLARSDGLKVSDG